MYSYAPVRRNPVTHICRYIAWCYCCIILISLNIIDIMCGTFTQLFAQALAIGVIDNIFAPNYTTSTVGRLIDVMLKGIATFWLYKWGQCTNGVRNANPLQNYNAMAILVGGAIGAVTLFAVGEIMGSTPMTTGSGNYVEYLVDAIAVHLVYGVSGSIVQNFASMS